MGRIYKRRRNDAYPPGQMLQLLSDLQLVAVLQGSSIWTAVDAATAHVLDMCCTGQQDGGPDTAAEVAGVLTAWRAAHSPTEMSIADRGDAVATSQPGPQEGQQAGTEAGQVAGTEGAPAPSTSGRPATLPIAIRLSLEESFFLKYTLDCLTVVKAPGADGQAGGEELSEQGLWDACRSIRANFPVSYAGYHHLKCKGWLPRSGLLYGVDFVVYQMHPTVMHSEFGVMLVPLQGPHRPDLRWLDVQITNRLINQVSKRLVLLYLHEAPDSPGHSTPACLDFFTAEERLLKRWVPSSTR